MTKNFLNNPSNSMVVNGFLTHMPVKPHKKRFEKLNTSQTFVFYGSGGWI
jgi:hypothetical protein